MSYRVCERPGLPLTGGPVPQARPGQPTLDLEQVFAEYPNGGSDCVMVLRNQYCLPPGR
jgi:hypothetical protein